MNLGWARRDLGQPGQLYKGGRGIGGGEVIGNSLITKSRILVVPLHVLMLEGKSRPDKATGMCGTRSRSTGTAPGRGRGRRGCW